MINLLPPQEKELLSQEYKWKLLLILGGLILTFFICFSLILLIINILISGSVGVQKIILDQQENALKNPQIQTLKENLISLNQTLSQLDFFYQNHFEPVEVLEKISKAIPSGIYLTSLSVVPSVAKEDNKTVCNLSGFVPTRDILLEFKENLEKEEFFEEVYFSPTNWVKPTDINFTVSFKIKK